MISLMASITIRLDESLKARLRVRAAAHGRSMEEEAREILQNSLPSEALPKAIDLGTAIRRHFGPLGGVELDLPRRDPVRWPPKWPSALR